MIALVLMRHAKSSWAEGGLADHARPLNARGRVAAPRIGRALARRGFMPEVILCSAARRTVETLDLVRPFLGRAAEHIEADLYHATPGLILRRLQRVPADCRSVLVIGHNPGLAELACALPGPGSDEAALAAMRRKYPTGAAAVFEGTGPWPPGGHLRLDAFLQPRDPDED
jgi:phosphohistidine phosphatase